MNPNFLRTFVITALSLGALGCMAVSMSSVRGSSRMGEEMRQVHDFTGVHLATFGTLYIEVGAEETLRIEAERNLLRYFVTEVQNDTLIIKIQSGVNLRTRKPVKFYLTVKALDKLELSSSGDIDAPNLESENCYIAIRGSGDIKMRDLEAETLEVHAEGSGKLYLDDIHIREGMEVTLDGSGDVEAHNLEADYLNANLSGSGKFNLSKVDVDETKAHLSGSGNMLAEVLRAERLEVTISGSGELSFQAGEVNDQMIRLSGPGDYNAGDLQSDTADVTCSGSGSATVRVREHLKATVSGSGNIHYTGNPTTEYHDTGSGEVKPIGR